MITIDIADMLTGGYLIKSLAWISDIIHKDLEPANEVAKRIEEECNQTNKKYSYNLDSGTCELCGGKMGKDQSGSDGLFQSVNNFYRCVDCGNTQDSYYHEKSGYRSIHDKEEEAFIYEVGFMSDEYHYYILKNYRELVDYVTFVLFCLTLTFGGANLLTGRW